MKSINLALYRVLLCSAILTVCASLSTREILTRGTWVNKEGSLMNVNDISPVNSRALIPSGTLFIEYEKGDYRSGGSKELAPSSALYIETGRESIDGPFKFAGNYTSPVGNAKGYYALTGMVYSDVIPSPISFSVCWNGAIKANSCTSWTGRIFMNKGTGNYEIDTTWLLYTITSSVNDWDSTNIKFDLFTLKQ